MKCDMKIKKIMSESRNSYKIVIAGEPGVGKTAVVGQLVNNCIKEYDPTNRAELKSYSFQINGEITSFQFWDISRREIYKSLSESDLNNAVGAILVFDITHRDSYEKLITHINDLKSFCKPNMSIILVGNKNDLKSDRKVTEQEAIEFAKRYNFIQYIETSAKTGDKIKESFETLARLIMSTNIQLKQSSILTVPFQSYIDDFLFIVNGKEYKTSRFIADILSPVISNNHSIDPTNNAFVINTNNQGDFSNILKLINFNRNIIQQSEIPFILEVIEILGNDSIDLQNCKNQEEISIDNVLSLIKKHEQYRKIFSSELLEEIEFASSHFFEICENKEDEFRDISIDSLIKILQNDKLKLESENQLLNFINKFYLNDSQYFILYEYVYFINVESHKMSEFLDICDVNYFTSEIWEKLKQRLKEEIKTSNIKPERYNNKRKPDKSFEFNSNNPFNGILNYFVTKNNGNISNDVNITASSVETNDRLPTNVVQYNQNRDCFYSKNKPNDWLCFDFKEHKIVLTNYTIKSGPFQANNYHPRSWVIEASNDNVSWETLDTKNDCSSLNGNSITHTFPISNQNKKEFRYIRYRQSKNWAKNDYIMIHSFELYGDLIL